MPRFAAMAMAAAPVGAARRGRRSGSRSRPSCCSAQPHPPAATEVAAMRFARSAVAGDLRPQPGAAAAPRDRRGRLCRRLPLVQPAREGSAAGRARRDLLAALVRLGRRFGATVMAHEDIETVAATGADGVHLPSGGDPQAARLRLPGALIGASAHSGREAASLLRAGADYVTVSPVFLTASKPGYGPALGLDGLAAHRRPKRPGRSWRWAGSPRTRSPSAAPPARTGSRSWARSMRAADRTRHDRAFCSSALGRERVLDRVSRTDATPLHRTGASV